VHPKKWFRCCPKNIYALIYYRTPCIHIKRRPNQRLQPTWQGAAKNDSKSALQFPGKMLYGTRAATRLKRQPLGRQDLIGVGIALRGVYWWNEAAFLFGKQFAEEGFTDPGRMLQMRERRF
jgi:hypothetical protein